MSSKNKKADYKTVKLLPSVLMTNDNDDMATIVYGIINPGTKTVYGKIIMVSEGTDGLLLHIEVLKKYRRFGVGSLAMDQLMNVFDSIVTAPDSEEGLSFCTAIGFDWEKSEKGHNQLVWRKK